MGKFCYYKKAIALQIITAICYFFSLTISQAQSVNHTTMEGADISIIFNNEVLNNEPQWRYGLIDVKLQPDWKTYWENSGNSGLSPNLQIENGIKNTLLFTAPHLLQEGKDWAYIYKDHAQILFRIAASDIASVNLKGNLLIGICNTICVPVDVPFILNSKPTNNFVSKLKIQTALNALPQQASDTFYVEEPKLHNKYIEVVLHLPHQSKIAELFLASDKAQLGIAKPIQQEPNKIIFSVPILSGKLDKGQKVHFIANDGNGTISGSINIADH